MRPPGRQRPSAGISCTASEFARSAVMKLSVVVCTYNYAHLLPDTLRTLAAQTVSDFELLIVDDGSTDNTEEIADKFRPQFQEAAVRAGQKVQSGILKLETDAITAMKGYGLKITDVTPDVRALWEQEFQHNYDSIIGPVFDPATVKLVQEDLKAYRK